MTFASVRVRKPANRLIYLNGDHVTPAGNSSNDTFTVSSGGNMAETVNGDGKVDNRKKFRVPPQMNAITIELDPVDPPEAV